MLGAVRDAKRRCRCHAAQRIAAEAARRDLRLVEAAHERHCRVRTEAGTAHGDPSAAEQRACDGLKHGDVHRRRVLEEAVVHCLGARRDAVVGDAH